MKCVCVKRCQALVNFGGKKKPRFFYPGEVWDFDECPVGFREVEIDRLTDEVLIDFATASEDELRTLEFDLKELKNYMKEKHPSVSFSPNIGRAKLIDKFLYARDNDLDAIDLE